VSEPRRLAILPRLGLRPTVRETVASLLDEAFADVESRSAASDAPGSGDPGPLVDALDAGCGRISSLNRYRGRIRRFVGVDLHAPAPGALPHLDEFVTVDVCGDPSAMGERAFDIVFSSFTVEHFGDPAAAFANLRRWVRPGGWFVLTTVNRRHPLVRIYLNLPDRIQQPLQRAIKATPADAHPLVGICNDPRRIRDALAAAGFIDIRVETVPNLARAWGRRWPAYTLGLIGDLLAQPFRSRRSTIVADARVAA